MTITDAPGHAPATVLPARMPTLDGLRGLGMLAVFVAHLVEYGGLSDSRIDRALMKLGLRGGYGVTMFFVLSGFLITGILLDAKAKPHYFRNFYARRSLRIFPLYLAFLALVFLVVPAVFTVSSYYRTQVHEQAWYWTYLTNIGVTAHGWAPGFQYFGHLWTLAVEEQFYLVWPLVVLLVRRTTLVPLCAVLVVAALVVRVVLMFAGHEVATDVLLPANLDALALGGLLAAWARGPRPFPMPLVRRAAVVATAGFVVVAAASAALPVTSEVTWSLQATFASFAFAAVILLSVLGGERHVLRRVLGHRAVREAGLMSYGFYVVHQPVLFLVVRGWHLDAGVLPAVAGSRLPGLLVVGVVAFALSAALAVASWRWFERPILALKSRFA